jgi:ABC-2 type transport system ATP-binding protein
MSAISPAAIDIRGLTKFYGHSRGVENVSLTVERGEVLGFLGPNGSGKTTVLRVLVGLISPTSGEVLVEGRSLFDDPRGWRERVGYLPGELGLYPNVSVLDYLHLLARLRGIDCSAEIQALSERIGLRLDARIAGLSKGNKQKVGVIQALMHRPDVLVLDEPTSGLDPIAQEEFARILDERRSEGASIILSSHVLQEVENVADRVVILDRGRVLAVDTVESLRRRIDTEIHLTFERPISLDTYRSCPGVVEVVGDDTELVIRATVPHTELLRCAAADGVVKVVSHEPTLADVFLSLTRNNRDS